MTPHEVLNLSLEPDNDAGAETVRGYLVALLAELWKQGEGFSGKRPLGNSGWDADLIVPLVKASAIDGELDEYGYLDACDGEAGDRLVREAIVALGEPAHSDTDEELAELETHREIAKRLRSGHTPHRAVYERRGWWYHTQTGRPVDMTPEQYEAIWPEERSDA